MKHSSSCAGLTRASTTFLSRGKDVDGRDKPSHDEIATSWRFVGTSRRSFLASLGGAAAAWPLAARAQQTPMPVIGFLNGASAAGYQPMVAAFRQGLEQSGYVEGRNVTIEYHWAEGQYDRLPAMADDFIRRRVTLLAATSTPAALVAKAATSSIPVVFTTSSNPVQIGLVASLSHPGGNLTGATQLSLEVGPKRVELAHELVPGAKSIALLINPASPVAETVTRDSQAAAATLGLQLRVLHANTDRDLDTAFTMVDQLHAGALVIGTDPLFSSHADKLAALVAQHAIPTIYEYHEFVAAGGLASYGGSVTDSYHLAGSYAGRILKGEKPADMPVQESTKVELIFNLKAAKALGLTIPVTLLGRADEVIE